MYAIMVLQRTKESIKGGVKVKVIEKRTQNSSSLFVVIPKDVAQQVGLKKGDDVFVGLNNKKEIVIKKQRKEQ
jgi:hypothetical protein